MHKELIIEAGNNDHPGKALIMLHGRGATAADILSLAAYLTVQQYALYAPQATHNTWYPYSFMIEPAENEPWLSSALELVEITVGRILKKGLSKDHIYFLGFSQGACLTLEYAARHAQKYGGIVAFTGGLIGDKIYTENYRGDFADTPVFIGTSDRDFHVPLDRVNETTDILKSMGASVTEKIYEDMGHTIIQDEIDLANKIVFQ